MCESGGMDQRQRKTRAVGNAPAPEALRNKGRRPPCVQHQGRSRRSSTAAATARRGGGRTATLSMGGLPVFYVWHRVTRLSFDKWQTATDKKHEALPPQRRDAQNGAKGDVRPHFKRAAEALKEIAPLQSRAEKLVGHNVLVSNDDPRSSAWTCARAREGMLSPKPNSPNSPEFRRGFPIPDSWRRLPRFLGSKVH